jgi:DNA-binding response OmpR family regulator
MAAPRILLVDDEVSLVKMVGKRLQLGGFEVIEAVDGEEALAKASAERPDLIILDLMLPKVTGFEVCKRLKQDAAMRHIPIVIFTARAQEKDEQLLMSYGADAYIRKPFRADELFSTIRKLLALPSA